MSDSKEKTATHVMSQGIEFNIKGSKAMGKEEFIKAYGESKNKITKNRHLYTDKESGLTWEVDNYTFLNLIVAEVELPEKDVDISMPEEIKDVLIMEATEFKEFSNHSLSDNIESM